MRLLRPLAGLGAALSVIAGGPALKITRGGVEPPPAGITGPAPGYSEEYLDPVDVDRLCRQLGVDANDQWNRKLIIACVAPKVRRIIFPHGVSKETRLHEYGHSHGYVHHDGGKGWVKAPNVFAQSPVQHDWSNVFGPKKPSETATAQNIFKGR